MSENCLHQSTIQYEECEDEETGEIIEVDFEICNDCDAVLMNDEIIGDKNGKTITKEIIGDPQ